MEDVKLYQARYYTKVRLTTKPWSFIFRIRFWPWQKRRKYSVSTFLCSYNISLLLRLCTASIKMIRPTITAKPINAMSALRCKWEEIRERRWELWQGLDILQVGGFSIALRRSLTRQWRHFEVCNITSRAHNARNKSLISKISTRFFGKEAKLSTHFGAAIFLSVIPRCFETTVSCETVEIGRLQNEYSPPGL